MTNMELAFRRARKERKKVIKRLINKTLNALTRARSSGLRHDWIRCTRYKSRVPAGLQRMV